MARRRDEVQQRMDAVVPETGITLDAGFLSQDVVVLSLEVADNLGEAAPVQLAMISTRRSISGLHEPRLIVDLVAEAGRIDDGHGDAGALFI